MVAECTEHYGEIEETKKKKKLNSLPPFVLEMLGDVKQQHSPPG